MSNHWTSTHVFSHSSHSKQLRDDLNDQLIWTIDLHELNDQLIKVDHFTQSIIIHSTSTSTYVIIVICSRHLKSNISVGDTPQAYPIQSSSFGEVFGHWSAPAASSGSTAASCCPARWGRSAATASPWAAKASTLPALCPACGEKRDKGWRGIGLGGTWATWCNLCIALVL